MCAVQQSVVDRIEAEFEQAQPVCVLSVYTPDYADSLEACELRAGLRSTDDWLVELEACNANDIDYLKGKYGVNNIHYMVNDSSTDVTEFDAGVVQYVAWQRMPSCSLDDALQFVRDQYAANPGVLTVRIGKANWRVR